MLDIVMMRLRTADGLDLADFAARYGSAASNLLLRALEPHERTGLVMRMEKEEGSRAGESVRLTDPEGFLVSNDVISDVFAALMPDKALTISR